MGLTRVRAEQISNIDYKQAVRVITLANISLTGSAPSQVDEVNLNVNDRILVAGQSTSSQNGLYDVAVVGSGSDGTWVRTTDANATGEINAGMIVMVTEGATYADTSWKLITNDPIIIGETGLLFAQNTGNSFGVINANGTPIVANGVTSTAVFSSGNNLVLTGNANTDTVTFAVSNTPVFTTVSATGNVSGNYFIGNGSQLTGLPATYGNSNVVNLLNTGLGGNIIPSANVTYSLGNVTNQWASVYVGANTLYINNVTVSVNADNILTVAGANVVTQDANGNINGGNVSATGNVTGNYILGNGSQLTGISVSSSRIFNGNSEANIGTTGGNANVSIGGVSNVAVFATTGIYITGEISANGNITAGGVRNLTSTTPPASPAVGDTWYDLATDTMFRYVYDSTNYFWQDISGGSIISTTVDIANYANANAVAYGESGWAGNIIPGANATYSLGNVTNQWKSLYVSNTTVYIGNVALSTDGNTLSVAGNPVVVASSGDSIALTGNLSAQGNVTGNYIIGNGSQLTGLPAGYANSNAATFFASGTVATDIKTTALISATGNVTGNYIIGNGSQLTGLPASYSDSNVATFLAAFGSNAISTTGTVTAGNITGANIVTVGAVSATGTITGSSLLGTVVSVTGNATAGNVLTGGAVSATGAITGNTLVAGGLSLTGNTIVGAGPTIVIDPNGSGGIDGAVVIAGNLSVQGNVTYIDSNVVTTNEKSITLANNQSSGAALDGAGIDVGNNTLAYWRFNNATTSWQSNIGLTPAANATLNLGGGSNYWATVYATGLTATGNVSGGNILTAGLISATANVTAGNVLTAGIMSSTGNATAGNVVTAGFVTATGNVTGNYILGNGALLTGLSGTSISNGTSNVTVVSSGGNITAGVGGTANALVITATDTSAVGNISAPQIIATNGLLVNSNVITGTFTLPANTNAISVGPILNAVGSNVTVPPGQRWIII